MWQAEEDTACHKTEAHNLIGCGLGTLNVVVCKYTSKIETLKLLQPSP